MKTTQLVLTAMALVLTACSPIPDSWLDGPIEIKLKTGETIQCQEGMTFTSAWRQCDGKGIKIHRDQIAEYRKP